VTLTCAHASSVPKMLRWPCEDAWRPYIREPDGEISRPTMNLHAVHLRSALRSGLSGRNSRGMLIRIPISFTCGVAESPPRSDSQTGTQARAATSGRREIASSLYGQSRSLGSQDSHVRIEDDEIFCALEAENRPRARKPWRTSSRHAFPVNE